MSGRVPRFRTLACAAIVLLAIAPGFQRASAATSIVVHPGAMSSWSVVNVEPSAGTESPYPTHAGTRGEFADGPSGAPKGLGSFRQVVADGSESTRLETADLDGASVGTITTLAYSTYVAAGSPGLAPQIQLLVDVNGDGVFRVADDDVLTFDPVYQAGGTRGDPVPNQCGGVTGCVAKKQWQRWNAAIGGWWSSRDGLGSTVVTLGHYQTLHPAATLARDVDAIRVTAGGGTTWGGFDGNLDAVSVGSIDYDFESFYLVADCGASADDIPLVQAKVDAAPAGFAVRLRGTCDFSQALPHGGTTASVANAAVVVRSGGPAAGLTIEPDGAPRSAVVMGSGTQCAFFVPPGSSNVTIRGLTFSNVGRAVVAVDASDVTIGVLGNATPDPGGNSVTGGTGMSSAILGVADGATSVTVSYGDAGAHSATYATGASPALQRLVVAGNRISYDTPGIPDADHNLVGVDVRQTGPAAATGITISHNAAWFATGELRSFDMNGIRVEGDPSAGSVDGVTIASNSIGRPDEVGEQVPPPTAAGGRVGIFAHRLAHVTIEANRVRAKMSATTDATPGGGIVASDTTAAVIRANVVGVMHDPGTAAADLGGIAVVDDVATLLGGTGDSLPSTQATIVGNTIGESALSAERGLLVDGSTWVDATGNSVPSSNGPSITLATAPSGAPATFPTAVAESVFCGNTLHGTVDDPNQIASGSGVTSSNYPGGGTVATNGECAPPGITIAETGSSTQVAEGGAGDSYSVRLDRRPRGTVTVAIGGGSQTTVAPSSLAFTPADWALPRQVEVSAVDDDVSEGTHLQAVTHVAASADAEYAGIARTLIVTIADNDPGSVIVAETGGSTDVAEGGATDQYTIVLGSRPGTDVRVTAAGDGQVVASPASVTFTQADWNIPKAVTVSAVDDSRREGPHTGRISHAVTSTDANFDHIPVAGILAHIVDNDFPLAPAITVPANGARVRTDALVVAGTGEPADTVRVTEGAVTIGTAVVSAQGTWSLAAATFSEGAHSIQAKQTDANGFASPASAASFVVDTTPPGAPIITFPEEGVTYKVAKLAVSGTAEPGDTVVVTEGSASYSTLAAANGTWTTPILFPAGPHTLIATALDGAGNPGPASPPRSFVVDADGIPPIAPTIVSPDDGAIVPFVRNGEQSIEVTGFAEPNCFVDVWDNGLPLGRAISGSDGFFDADVSIDTARDYRIHVRAVDESGNAGPFSALRTVHVDGKPPLVSVRRASGQFFVALDDPVTTTNSFGATSDNYGVASVSVEYTDRVTGAVITHDAVICCEDDRSYLWSDDQPLPPGVYHVVATAIDVAGNVSNPSTEDLIRT